jgi:hypothetical protein
MSDPQHSEDSCERALRITNEDGELDAIILEPWIEEIAVKTGDIIDIVGEGPNERANLESEIADGALVVWAWPGSLLHVRLNGDLIETASSKTRTPPTGNLSVKEFLEMIGMVTSPYTRSR